MNPDLPGYVARKVGTSDGEYELRSKYIKEVPLLYQLPDGESDTAL